MGQIHAVLGLFWPYSSKNGSNPGYLAKTAQIPGIWVILAIFLEEWVKSGVFGLYPGIWAGIPGIWPISRDMGQIHGF